MPDKFFRSVLPGELRETPKIDTSVAHIARVYDYWLGGKDKQVFAIDREVGQTPIIQARHTHFSNSGTIAVRGLSCTNMGVMSDFLSSCS